MRKDGSEALAGERPVENGKGTVRLRREPPVCRVLFSRCKRSARPVANGKVRGANPCENATLPLWPRQSRHGFRKADHIGAIPIGGPTLDADRGVRAAPQTVNLQERVQAPSVGPIPSSREGASEPARLQNERRAVRHRSGTPCMPPKNRERFTSSVMTTSAARFRVEGPVLLRQ